MLSLKVKNFLSFIQGKLEKGSPDFEVKSISTDSRTIKPGDFFIPLSGENFDGHNFIEGAQKKGACGFITSKKEFLSLPSEIIISVSDPLEAYQRLARFQREKFSFPVVAVTGSNGKTTTKELVAGLLKQKYTDLLKSRENFNNEIGVPKTIFELSEENDCLVLEFAMRGPGEIALLSDIALPSIGVITNIGEAHIGRLGSKEAIAKAKGELLEKLPSDGLAVLNKDNEWFSFLEKRAACKNVLTCGLSDDCHIFAENITEKGMEGAELDICFNGRRERVFFPVPGRHNIYNLLAAVAVSVHLIDNPSFKEVLKDFTLPTTGRTRIKKNKRNMTVIDDTYNSNPLAVKNTLDMMVRYFPEGRKIALLGDMLELGSEEVDGHSKVGEWISHYGIDYLLTYGPLSKYTVNEALARGARARDFSDKDKLIEELKKIIEPGDIILVKGSRGMRMEEVVEYLLDS